MYLTQGGAFAALMSAEMWYLRARVVGGGVGAGVTGAGVVGLGGMNGAAGKTQRRNERHLEPHS